MSQMVVLTQASFQKHPDHCTSQSQPYPLNKIFVLDVKFNSMYGALHVL